MSTTPPPGAPALHVAHAPIPAPTRRQEEEEEEKRQEKDEKPQEEKWRRDPLSAIVWACILSGPASCCSPTTWTCCRESPVYP